MLEQLLDGCLEKSVVEILEEIFENKIRQFWGIPGVFWRSLEELLKKPVKEFLEVILNNNIWRNL